MRLSIWPEHRIYLDFLLNLYMVESSYIAVLLFKVLLVIKKPRRLLIILNYFRILFITTT